MAKKYCHNKEDYREEGNDDYLFLAYYSCEGDCVSVVESELK